MQCQALVLAPTRELALQIHKVLVALGDYMNVVCHACVGGTRVCDDIAKLESDTHVVVGTPVRVFDHISRGALRTSHINMFVLKDADEMLCVLLEVAVISFHSLSEYSVSLRSICEWSHST